MRACLGPTALERCPAGILLPDRAAFSRCGSCQAVWQQTAPPRRPRDSQDRAENTAILQAWREANGPVCPGCPGSGWQPHPVDEARNPLTVDHTGIPAAGNGELARTAQPKRVMCRAGNSALGAHL